MKKFIYVLLIALSASVLVTSCTEEEVAPKTEADGTVGGGGDPGKI